MMDLSWTLLCLPCSVCLILGAGELSVELQAKFIKILAANAGSVGKVACTSPAMLAQFERMGITPDPSAKVAWASSEAEVIAMKAAGKFVLCPDLDWLPKGASVAVIEEGGKAQIYLHMGHIAASGVTLSDSILKIGKRI